ncbi:hypothetical protein [Chryseobacterium indoltheticum]|uniref:hypothetical protein n=1 Tax=Chryseobacterium indoltheticum TaxID=254 RepID=UPI003F4955D7
MYVHGGAWVEGDKVITANNYVESTILKLLEKNILIISINYRLVTEKHSFSGTDSGHKRCGKMGSQKCRQIQS